MNFLSKSVDDVIKPLTKALDDLKIIATNQTGTAITKRAEAEQAEAEASRANKLIAKLNSLLDE